MNKYIVKVEANEYEVDAPDENTAWAWANYYHQQNPPKQEEINPFRESIGAVGRGVLGGIASAAHGVGSIVSSGAELLGARDTADRWRAENDELLKKNREYFDKTISPPTTLPGKVIEGVSNLAPVIAGGPLTLAPSIVSMANQTQKSLNDQGVPPQTASNVAVAQTAANTALMAIPVLKPAMSIILNSGSGVAADAISAQLLNEYKEAQDPYTPKSEQYWVNRAIELILGYGFSNKSKNTVQRDVGDTPPKPAEPSVEPNKGFFTGEGQEIKPESLTPNKLDQVPTSEHYYKMAEDLASRGDAEGFKTAIDEANRLKAMEIGEQITPEEKGLPALWERADTEVPTLGKKPEVPETPLPEIKSDVESGTPYHPEAMKAAIERDALDKQIDSQYERILKMEEMISGEGMTSEMLPMRDKLVEAEYNKLSELQSKRNNMDAELPAPVKEVVDTVRKVGKMKKQGGAIDPQVFKEGFKRATRALSRLTDQPWLKARFPSTEYMSNSDGTPLVMLHGTKSSFTKLSPAGGGFSDQGVHLGFTVPSHLIHRASLDTSVNLRGGRKRLDLPYDSHETSTRQTNIHPVVIKKGNYPYIDRDMGVWSPNRIFNSVNFTNGFSFKTWILEQSKKNNGTLNQMRLDWYGTKLSDSTYSESILNENVRLFNQLLKEARVDGFFYKNDVESLTNHTRAPRYNKELPHRQFPVPVKGLQKTISFVTWDENNVRSVYDPPKGVPSSQRGGAKGTWNPFEVRKALEKKFREVYEGKRKLEAVNIRTSDDVKEQVFAKAGIKGLQLIPDVPKLSPELIAKFKEIPDVGPHNLLQSGAMSKIEHNNRNQLLLWQHRVLDRGYKIGQWMNMKWVRPVENQMYSILRNDRNVRALHDVFMEELNSKTRHSPEQLASKLSPELQTAYKNMRDLFDKTIQEVNKAEDALGLKRTDPHTAYYSAVFSGPWRFTVYAKNEDGTFRPVWHVAERSRGQAKKALKYLRGQGFQNGLFYTPIKYDGTHSSGSIFKGQFKELLEMFDKSDPVHQQIKDVMEQLALGSTEIKGTEKHFIPKTGVRGFQGDRPWVNPVKDARDGFIAQFQYIKNALDWAGYQQGMREVKTLMDELNKDPAYSDTHPNTLKWMKDYADSHAGIATIKSFEGLQNDLAKALGTDVRFLETLLGGSKSGFYIHTLGWNAPFLATQIIQPVFTAPQHVKISERGFDHNAGKTHVEGSFYGLLAFGKDSAQWMHEQGIPMFEGDLHGVWKDAFDYLQANRLIDINPTSDIQELHRPQGLRMVSDWGSSPIIVSERIARSMAFFSFVSHYNQSGMFKNTVEDRLAMFRLAEEATNLSMVDYRPQEKPMIFSKMGLAGNALNTFQAYKFNYLNQYVAYAGQALKGKPAAFMTMTALGLAYAGVQGMVGLEDADALLDLIKAAWPAKYLGGLPPEVLKFTIRGFVLDNFPKYVSVGPVSAISGLNMYSRFSMADVTPLGEGSPLRMLSQIFPWAGFLAQGFKSIYDLLAPDSSYKEKIAAGYFLTPSGLKGLYEESWPGTKTEEGLSLDPRDIDRGKYRRNETESAVRKWGFYGVDEAMSRDKSYRNKATDRWYSEEKKRITDSFRSNFIHGKLGPMERQIKRYISLEGDIETLLSQTELQKAFVEMNTTEKERVILAAQSGKYPAVAKMLRYLK